MSDEEEIEKWRVSYANRVKSPNTTLSRAGKKEPKEPLKKGCKTPKNEAQRDKPVVEGNQTLAILLKPTVLQGMHPIKFSRNPSHYPAFRNRLRDNLEDGILNDSQKFELLPKSLSGKAYEIVERVS